MTGPVSSGKCSMTGLCGEGKTGEGKIVEIDKRKFGKRKFSAGRIVAGQWGFGGIYRDTHSCFMAPVEKEIRRFCLLLSKT